MRLYHVTVGHPGGDQRILSVQSETGVQAGDAAVARMSEDESILSIEETTETSRVVEPLPTEYPRSSPPDTELLSWETAGTTATPALFAGSQVGPESELLEDGQEEVFSRTEVELGRIEHETGPRGADGPPPFEFPRP